MFVPKEKQVVISTTVSPEMVLLRKKHKIAWSEALRKGFFIEVNLRERNIDEESPYALKIRIAKLAKLVHILAKKIEKAKEI